MGIGLIRGLGAFGLGALAGTAGAYESYKRQRELENTIAKAMGKQADVKEPSFKDFWDRAPGNKALSSSQAPAPVSDATTKPVEQTPAQQVVAESTPAPDATGTNQNNDDMNASSAELRDYTTASNEIPDWTE